MENKFNGMKNDTKDFFGIFMDLFDGMNFDEIDNQLMRAWIFFLRISTQEYPRETAFDIHKKFLKHTVSVLNEIIIDIDGRPMKTDDEING